MATTGSPGDRRRRSLVAWFRENGRSFPWRHSGAAFWPTFVSEMLLRRTRADQVAQALAGILDRFPTSGTMAAASEDDVVAALSCLGLRWRAVTLHAAARHLNGADSTPSRNQLLQLSGVGPYVADSVRAVAAGDGVVLTDTNSVRVATRVRGIRLEGDIRRRRDVQEALHVLFDGPAPAEVWWAVIDLGAMVCTPTQPACDRCPLASDCVMGIERRQAREA